MSSPLPTERTAVVTGGASPRGIGRATADRLARDGWSVAILDIDEGAAKLAADEVADKYSVSTLGVGADISDENSVQAAIAQVESALPPIIGLANIAGVSSPTEFHGRHTGRVGPGVQRQHARHIPGHPTRIARHDRRRDRPDRQCLLHLRAARWRDVLEGALQRVQGGRHRFLAGAWPGRWARTTSR